ncbi:phosphoinositide 3-kinase regulatory subunit 4 isoform X3 [Hylaeus volcanicus]|uniref:phosphoinositide 3-kinase regulatory subunit 4 isoform X3 n=1 Tax=Hylaeus volcanicus TaxID=313075 RepID=UPI0023B7DD71|nr:phosphoinositide 3-kinase regulatory subunit 4 isoform X3 [Hylaeus volcanicus]
MGNQLVGIAPSQIFPVEHYLTDHSDLLFDVNLGSTRFFKVARARSQEGLIVVKVFAIHDPTLPLSAYKDKLEEIRSKLASAVNCLPFQRMILTEKSGSIMREYVKYSLYDRISTRPFLTSIEKKWITFQVLYALHQAHKFGVCHGDIKLENIMITSWNWILLTDFASFKPTYLPEDNPADFSYFFDTSRRRTCYIAPERFVKTLSSELNNTLLLSEQELKTGDLHPMMDIFSAGCALTELYNEGHPPFDFSQLLAYRNNEYSVSKHLDTIDDSGIRELLSSMLERNPGNRKTAEIYLAQARGIIFPEYFYSFLQSYMLIFSAAPILSPDEKINRLKKDIGNIINILKTEENEKIKSNAKATETVKSNQFENNVESNRNDSTHSDENTVVEGDSDQSLNKSDLNQADAKVVSDYQKQKLDVENEKKSVLCQESLEGLVIITQLVTSCIRGLHHSQSKLQSLEILLELAENTSDETILDRILPYIFHLVHDPAPRVRVSAMHTLTKCLHLVKSIPPSDVNIFPEYILPGLAHIIHDEAVIVRAAYAENIAHLAHIALRYLENSHLSNLSNKEGPKPSYDSELQTLHEMVQQSVSMLLTDPQNLVKQTLMESGINKLCVFFGKQKANDILLSHVITFLNDKEDKELRGSFFECIVGVAAYVGWHSSPILMPLLQQGLADPEEFVTTKAINAMATLTELGLLHKSALYQLLYETMVFLVHPNLWIRHATVGFISAAARTLNLVDVQCKVQTMIQPYLKHPLIQIEKEILLLEALVPPIPRIVYDSIVKYNDIQELFQVLEQRQMARAKAISGIVPQYSEMSTSLRNLFRRLSSESMTEIVEDQLLIMQPHLMKINKYRSSIDAKQNTVKSIDGKLELSSMKDRIRHHIVILYPDTKVDLGLPPFKRLDSRTSDSIGTYATMNQEWRTMFAAQDNVQHPVKMTDMTGSSGSPSQSLHGGDIHLSPQHSLSDMNSINDHSLHERSYIQYRCAPCRLEVRQLTYRKQEQHAAALRAQHWADNIAWQTGSRLLPSGWRPRGIPVAHLHEHRAAINRLVSIPDTSLFASSSADGCIKIWDASKMEGRNIANRSRQTYMHRGGPLIGLAICDQGKSLASSASQSGTVFVLRIESNSSKMSVIGTRQLDLQEEGCAVDLQYLDSGSQSVLVYASLYGSLVGWDLRCPGTTWRLENDLKYGVITSFCVNNYQQWLTLGTSSGVHTCWDLRFQLPITSIKHPTGARVRKVITHPTEHSWIISAVQGNNEISMWNLETDFRQMVLWASSAPPLSYSQSGHSVCAMYSGCIDRSGFLLAGGTDMRLRFWDLNTPNESYVALPAANDVTSPNSLGYEQRLIDGTNVVQEVLAGGGPTLSSGGSTSVRTRNSEEGGQGPETPPSGHHDTISADRLGQQDKGLDLGMRKDQHLSFYRFPSTFLFLLFLVVVSIVYFYHLVLDNCKEAVHRKEFRATVLRVQW